MSTTTEAAPQKERTRSLYRGDPGMWSWVLHRITGVATFFFLFVHVLDTALVRVNPDTYDAVIDTYKNPLVGLMEIGLVGVVLYHALNGVRVMLVDFWSKGPKYQRVMLWTILTIWFLVMIQAPDASSSTCLRSTDMATTHGPKPRAWAPHTTVPQAWTTRGPRARRLGTTSSCTHGSSCASPASP